MGKITSPKVGKFTSALTHGEFKRRVKTQCALPSAETAAMLFWALMVSGQITMRRVDGWQTLDQATNSYWRRWLPRLSCT